jgi:hypothetical protein
MHYVHRVDHQINAVLKDVNIMPIVLQSLTLHCAWADHVARMSGDNCCKHVHLWRDARWLRYCLASGKTPCGLDRPRIRWGSVGARWDDLLEEEGLNWQTFAQNRAFWVKNKFIFALRSFVKLAKKPMG